MESIWPIVLTSAGIAALISATITGASTLWGQCLERKARRKEIIFQKAVELAIERTRFVKEVAKEMNADATLMPYIHLVEQYYKGLEYLINSGKLPQELRNKIDKKIKAKKEKPI